METTPQALSASPGKEPFNFMDYMQFKRMITLQVIPVLYGVVAVLITLGGLVMMFSGSSGYGGMGYGMPFGGGGFFSGLIFILVGNILWRMWCEIVLVLFRINKTLSNIEKNTGK